VQELRPRKELVCLAAQLATEAKGTVLLKNAEELLNYNRSEEKKMEETIESIASSGVKVVIAHGSISEMAQHFLDKFGLMTIKIQSKFDLRRICGALGATAVIRLGPCSPEEMGECSLVEVKEVAGRKVTVFNQLLDEDTTVSTIIVRASTENVLNDVERALDDGINSVKSLCSDPRLLPSFPSAHDDAAGAPARASPPRIAGAAAGAARLLDE
jgi:T-complex protein 1 subunit theta